MFSMKILTLSLKQLIDMIEAAFITVSIKTKKVNVYRDKLLYNEILLNIEHLPEIYFTQL